VGISDDSGGGQVDAFLYSDGVMIDLSLLEPVVAAGWTNLEASAINDNGQIAGKGILHGTTQAFLLSPFPIPVVTEPETYAMLLAGLGLLGSAARWRRRGT
jgi:probable HAF family extracellular repeat protein